MRRFVRWTLCAFFGLVPGGVLAGRGLSAVDTIAAVAGDSVTFRLEGEVTIDQLTVAIDRFRDVLAALNDDQRVNVRWVLAGLDFGSAAVTARAEALDEESIPKVAALPEQFLEVARQVSTGADDPARPLLRVVRDLTKLSDASNPLVMETADDEVMFTAPVAPAADRTGSQRTTKSLGTVRGRVETLSHRKGLRFTLYDLAADRPVSCYLQPGLEDLMRDAWGRIADVTGVVTRDAETGRARAVRHVTSVDVVSEGDATGFLRARGAVGGTEPAELVIRRMRNAS